MIGLARAGMVKEGVTERGGQAGSGQGVGSFFFWLTNERMGFVFALLIHVEGGKGKRR